MTDRNERNTGKRRSYRSSVAKAGAAAMAAGLGLSVSPPADAAIIYTDIADVTINDSSYDLDVNNDAVIDFRIFHNSDYPDLVVDGYQIPNRVVGGSFYADALSAGENIDAGRQWYYGGYMAYSGFGPWPGEDNKYLGLRFEIPNGSTHYGWARLSVDYAAVGTLFDYAYESEPDTGIPAGAVPIPSSLLLLASGAVSLVAYRRKREDG